MRSGLGSVVASGVVALGLLLATGAMLVAGGSPPSAPPAPTATATVVPTAAPSLQEQGRTLFQAKGCIGCHSVTDKGLVSRVGFAPDLSALAQRAGALRPDLSAEAYVVESIRQPQAYYVPGFGNRLDPDMQMPTLPVSDAELDALVAFLLAPPGR